MSAPQPAPSLLLRVPPPIWALGMLVVAYGLQRSFLWASVVYVRVPMVAVLLAAAGVALSVWGRNTFAAAGTEIMPTSATNKKLVTDGPFRFSRNPMYLGLVLFGFGIALYAGSLPFLLVPVLLFLLCNFTFIPFEEAKMQRQFGAPYTDYLHRVRRWV